MIMGSLTITWRCGLLMILVLYIQPQVDSTQESDQTPSNSSSHQKECSALLQFINSVDTGAACSKTDSWMEDKDCCSWEWVGCDSTERVFGVHLDDSCLRGTLNLSTFLQLPHLEYLSLTGNRFTSLIPAPLSKLENLSHLGLSGNMFSGQIPDIFSNVRQLSDLDLSGNNFSGPIPHSLCDGLPTLSSLQLFDNFLNGGVPSCLFNMPSLSYIDLANNQLTGPTGQFNLTSSVLASFYFGNNEINGPIPSSIFELVNLVVLDLSSNHLTGTFKFGMLPKLRLLESLDLSGNSLPSFSFNGNVNEKDISSIVLTDLRLSSCNITEFPSFLSSFKNLESLDLSNNKISEFPSFMSSFEKLESLDLSNNIIHGQILKNGSEGWANLRELNLSHNFLTYIEHPWTHIESLYLDNNRLQGSLLVPPDRTQFFVVSNNMLTGNIPVAFCNFSSLYALELSGNSLGGEIPKCFESLIIGLKFLHLQNNILQGSIPDIFANASLLLSLDLSGNNLEGPLPPSLNSCEKLEVLNVGNNKIRDIFPHWLGTLPTLEIVVLKSNQFYGMVFDSNVSFSTLRILDLSCNKFIGPLSIKLFENMEQMMSTGQNRYDQEKYMEFGCGFMEQDGDCAYLDRREYSLSLIVKGNSVKFDRVFKDFRAIDLSNNSFEGSIPEILGKFKSLTILNLSHNSLTGKIPSSFGNMTALESLDLSSNQLEGRIPEQMESLTFLAVLNLSYNRLSGPIPQGGQFSTYESDSFVENKRLCGKPLPEKCNNDLVPWTPPPFWQEDEVAKKFSWKIAMMGYGCGLVIGMSVGYIVLSTRKLMWLERMVEGRLHKKVRRPC